MEQDIEWERGRVGAVKGPSSSPMKRSSGGRGDSDDITLNVSLEEDIKGKVETEGITNNE